MTKLCCLALLLLVTPAVADDEIGWPCIRGPQFNNHSAETGLADHWPAAGPPVVWTRKLGQGYSSFTAQNGRVFTQYQSVAGQYVLCLDAETGDTIWEHRYAWPYDPTGLYPGPRATPSLAGDSVYFSGPDGLVGCLSQKTGKVIWEFNAFERFDVKPVDFGFSCSPIPIQDKILLPVGSPGASMVALDPRTGATLWHSGDAPISHVPAYPIQFGDRWQVVALLRNALLMFDLETGKQLWEHNLSAGYDEHAAWPIFHDSRLWIARPFRSGCQLMQLDAEDRGSLTVVWKESKLANDVSSSILVDGFLYGFDIQDVQSKVHRPSRGAFRCLSFLTGEEQWSNGARNERRRLDQQSDQPLAEQSIGQASVLFADGKLILFNDTGELILARANPERYEPLERVRVLGGEIVWTQPMLYRGRLYLRNHSHVACLDLREPTDDTDKPKLTLADIPQSTYRDWASIIMPIEPEYAMDAPRLPRLQRWFWSCLICLTAGIALAGLAWAAVAAVGRKRPSARLFWRLEWALTFVIAALGTTLLSRWTEDFLFTWPVCLFVGIQATVAYARLSKAEPAPNLWAGRAVLLGMLSICLTYFLLCRRLSLAYNWVFLMGLPMAVPPLLLARRINGTGWRNWAAIIALTLIAFAAFYWSTVGMLLWKYPTE